MARLNTNGTLDDSFGIGGRQFFLATGFESHRLNAVAIADNGKIVVAGAAIATGAGHRDGLLAQLTAAGTLDIANFGAGDGVATYNLGGARDDFFSDVVLDSDTGQGQFIYAVGASETEVGSGLYRGWATYKLPNGSNTGFFGADGDLLVNAGHDLAFSAVHRQADGKLILAGTGTTTMNSDSDFFATRVTGGINGGGADLSSFNAPDGRILVDIFQDGRQDTAFGMAVHGGRIVIAGTTLTSTPPSNLDFAVAALALDRIFVNDFEND